MSTAAFIFPGIFNFSNSFLVESKPSPLRRLGRSKENFYEFLFNVVNMFCHDLARSRDITVSDGLKDPLVMAQ
jgi:hypothetical protein